MFAIAAISSRETIVNKYLQNNKGVNWNGLTVDDLVVVAYVAGSVIEACVDVSVVESYYCSADVRLPLFHSQPFLSCYTVSSLAASSTGGMALSFPLEAIWEEDARGACWSA
ncbi:hypothetical protein TNCV_4901441 [Trichonephila clavipes]|nr:hypothetical protein TNCV_4901441 [Trichonephila clavipes]